MATGSRQYASGSCPYLTQCRAGGFHNVRDTKATADLDQLTSADNRLPARANSLSASRTEAALLLTAMAGRPVNRSNASET